MQHQPDPFMKQLYARFSQDDDCKYIAVNDCKATVIKNDEILMRYLETEKFSRIYTRNFYIFMKAQQETIDAPVEKEK